MLEHQKLILNNLNGVHPFFENEINKSKKWLTVQEWQELKIWLKKELGFEIIDCPEFVLEQELA